MKRLPCAAAAAFLLASACAIHCGAAGEEMAAPDAGRPEVVIRAGIDWLVNILPRGGAEAAARYQGRTLLISGWVEEMGRDNRGWYITLRRASARTTKTQCYFPASGGGLDLVYKGLDVEVIGVCAGYDAATDAVVLKECRLVVQDYRPEEE